MYLVFITITVLLIVLCITYDVIIMSLVFIPCAHVHCSVSPHVFVKECLSCL